MKTILSWVKSHLTGWFFDRTVRTVRSGSWYDPSIWSTGKVPGSGDTVKIMQGMTVTFPGDVTRVLTEINRIEMQPNTAIDCDFQE
jgi:hypothetical protein